MSVLSLEELKSVELSLLIKIDDFCKKNDIKYYLHAGTLLGAVRHQGFIPWDDDIDIAMDRDNYEKFRQSVISSEADFGYVSFETNSNYAYPFAKAFDKSTKIIEPRNDAIDMGIFIDIFPLDNMPLEYNKALKFVKKCHFWVWLCFIAKEEKIIKAKKGKVTNLIKMMLHPIVKAIGYKFFVRRTIKLVQKYNSKTKSKYIANAVSPNYIKVFQRKWYSDQVNVLFEGESFKAPIMWDELLKCMYRDYMKLPPLEKQITHHEFDVYFRE